MKTHQEIRDAIEEVPEQDSGRDLLNSLISGHLPGSLREVLHAINDRISELEKDNKELKRQLDSREQTLSAEQEYVFQKLKSLEEPNERHA